MLHATQVQGLIEKSPQIIPSLATLKSLETTAVIDKEFRRGQSVSGQTGILCKHIGESVLISDPIRTMERTSDRLRISIVPIRMLTVGQQFTFQIRNSV